MKTPISVSLRIAIVAAVGFVMSTGCGRGPRVVDGIIYEPTAERLVMVVKATTPEGQTGDWSINLNLETPVFSEIFRKGATTFGITGGCRPMVTGDYMLEMSLSGGTDSRPPNPSHSVSWTGPVQLGKSYSAQSPTGGEMTFTLSKSSSN